jgi:hypothetical protein
VAGIERSIMGGLEKAIEAAQRDPWQRGHLNDNLAWLLATCPDAKFRDPTRAVERARKAVELVPNAKGQVHRFYTTLGGGLLPPRRPQGGRRRSRSVPIPVAVDWHFGALPHAKLGTPEETRKWYNKAVLCLEKNSQALEQEHRRVEELRRFCSHAEEVLELKKK